MISAVITPDPSAPYDLVLRFLDGTPARGILQSCGRYFPASMYCNRARSSPRSIHAILHIPLLPGAADAFFGGGQVFTVWADAIVDDINVRGVGLLGDGVIVGRGPTGVQDVAQTAAHLRPSYRPAVALPLTEPGTPALAWRP